MRSINFCLDSSHEIDQFLSWFFTWDWSICLNSSHQIDHLPWFFTWDQSMCHDSSYEIDQFLSWFFTWDQWIDLPQFLAWDQWINLPQFLTWDQLINPPLFLSHCLLCILKHLPFQRASKHSSKNDTHCLFGVKYHEFSNCDFELLSLWTTPQPNPTQPNPSPQISSSFPILHQTCYFSSSLMGWKSLFWQASAHYAGTASPQGSPVEPKWAC